MFFNEDNFQVKLTEEMVQALGDRTDGDMILGIRPDDIYDKVYASNASPDNTLTATVEVVEPMGSETYIYLTTGKTPFIARFDAQDQVEVNTDIELVFDMSKAHLFDPNTGETIH
jgi:multiple sugar transport system ATP-binding protein